MDIDASAIHAEATRDELYVQRQIWKRAQSAATASMVARCLKEKERETNKVPGDLNVTKDVASFKPP